MQVSFSPYSLRFRNLHQEFDIFALTANLKCREMQFFSKKKKKKMPRNAISLKNKKVKKKQN